jgi:hypothetical protein
LFKLIKNIFIYSVVTLLISCSSGDTKVKVKIDRWEDGLIIPPNLTEEIGTNVQGPSLIKVPEWAENRLGDYYLYFADHKGDHIRLAFSDDLKGPWKIKPGGSLRLADSHFLTAVPETPEDFNVDELEERTSHPDLTPFIVKSIDDLNVPHIASPDVHVDEESQKIIMYFHGLDEFGSQKTRVATSLDGINFVTKEKIVGWPYFRKFTYQGDDYALSMPGVIYKNIGDIEDYIPVNQVMEDNVRHSAVLVKGEDLLIFFSRVGDKPERIMLSTIDLSKPSILWKTTKPIEVLRPEEDWEGGNLPLYPSIRSAINTEVNQLRDPAIFQEGNNIYLLYSVRGENGIAIADLKIIDQ